MRKRERWSGSHVLDFHGLLWPAVCVLNEGVVIRAVDVRQDKRLLVFRLGVQRSDIVLVCIVDNLAEKETGSEEYTFGEVNNNTELTIQGSHSLIRSALETYFVIQLLTISGGILHEHKVFWQSPDSFWFVHRRVFSVLFSLV